MRGSIRQRSKGSWQLRYLLAPDSDGNQKQASETVRGNKKEAERVLRERVTQIENGGFVLKTNETASGFMQRWLDTYAKTNTRLRTQQGYRSLIRASVVPALGPARLQQLRPQQIQKMYSDMLDRGLSPRTVIHVSRGSTGGAVPCCEVGAS